MDITDIRCKKRELERNIFELINNFEGETDVKVVDVVLTTKRIKIIGTDKTEIMRTIDAKLEL